MTNFPPEDCVSCQDCGMAYEPWTTNNRLWNRVMGGPDGILCPRCFAIRASRHARVWSIEAEPSETTVELRRALFHERENFARAEEAERVIEEIRSLLIGPRWSHCRSKRARRLKRQVGALLPWPDYDNPTAEDDEATS